MGGPFVVNHSGDAGDSSPGDGFCRIGSSLTDCTLRAALEEANALAGTQDIHFNLPSGDDYIYPASALPEITGPVIIDGTTQPGFDGGKPLVHVDGSHLAAAPAKSGFKIAAGIDVTIQGLQILRFSNYGIENYGNLTLDHLEVAVNQYGGIYSFKSSDGINITLNNSTVFENTGPGVNGTNTHFTMDHVTADRNTGGGIRIVGGTLSLDHGGVSDNTVSTDGGGIYLAMAGNPTIRNTTVEGNSADQKGGGLYHWGLPGTMMIVENGTFEGNHGYDGGGIYIDAGTSRLNSCTLISNQAERHGGGVFANANNNPTLWIAGRSVLGRPGAGNVANATPASDGLGGGIYSKANLNISETSVEGNTGDGIYNDGGTVRLQDSVVDANTLSGIESFISGGTVELIVMRSKIADNGSSGIGAINADLTVSQTYLGNNGSSGIRMNGGTLTMDRSAVEDNRSGSEGGGIAGYNLSAAAISNATVSGNSSAASGGGLYLWGLGLGAVLNLNNMTVSGNRAATTGGAIEAAGGTIKLNNVTLAQNTAASAGGLHSAATVNLTNTILAENTGGNCGGPIASDGYNLDSAATCAFAGTGDLTGLAAGLGPLQDNGGTTFTHALLPGSPALEAGNDATCLAADQRGVARPQGLHCDIGAFEAESPATATPPPATITRTPTFSPTRTPTLTAAPFAFDPINFSTDVIYAYGRTCNPKEVTVQAKVTPAELVKSVGLFFRLEEKNGPKVGPWSAGLAMIPQGGGWYQLTLYGEDLIGNFQSQDEIWVAMQFIANGKEGQVLARSPIIHKLTLGRCYQ